MNRRTLLLETFEDRILCSAVPSVTVTAPAKPLLGQVVALTATFDNTSATDTGYGPYVDVYLPATGADGAGAATDDGLTFVNGSATYLGAAVTTTVLTFDAAGHATHPYAKTNTGASLVINGTAGDQLVVFQLPFGSFTPNQPAAPINFSAQLSNLADVGSPLTIRAGGGFQYGNDALNNPTSDPSLTSTLNTTTITPTLFTLTKTYLGPEDETATGPNFKRQYLITVDLAAGQTLTNLQITDLLPNNLQFVSVDSTTIRGTLTATTAIATPSTTTPGGTLTRQFASVTGTAATDDATLLFTYYVPRANSLGNAVINAVSGDDVISNDDASSQGTWTPIDGRDASGTVISNDFAIDHTLTDKSIAIQKSVTVVNDTGATGASPGDTLEYTMTFQVSDYFAFQNLIASDVFSDGQKLTSSFTPTLTVSEHGVPTSGTFNAANFTLGAQNTTDGTTGLTFRISNELITRGLDGKLLGGNVPNAGTGGPLPQSAPALNPGTTATITFRTTIQDNFDYNFPSGDASVDQGDTLSNNVSIAGDLLSVADASTPTGQSEADTSAAGVVIVKGSLTKSVYAINGNTSFGSPVKIAPGDTVTYRLTYTLPTSDVEGLAISDFLPLPIFDATTLTSFDNVVSAAAPAAGHVKFGPSDTFHAYSGLLPSLSTDAVSNSLSLSYPNYDSPLNQATTVDLLLTVTASANPFADGLFLTNQARVAEGTTNAGNATADAIVQIQLTEPVLNVKKGVVATDKAGAVFSPGAIGPVAFNAPGTAGSRFSGTVNSNGLAATPINSNLNGIDAGDVVTFAIVVENTGTGLNGAFDVRLRDTLPAGFTIPGGAGLNLRVVDGTGAALGFINMGTGLFDAAGGIELTDPGSTNPDPGSLDAFDATDGRNILVLTYDLVATTAVQPGQTLTNTATVYNYAGAEAGPDHTTTDLTDTATVTIATPTPSKSLVSTSESFTGLVAGTERAAIGEVIRYRLVTQIPEGAATNFRLVDYLPAGLTYLNDGTTNVAFVSTSGSSLTSSTLSGAGLARAGDESTLSGITPTFVLPGGAILGGAFATGTDPTFVFGDLTNADSDANGEFVVLEFNALVDNSVAGSNDAGDTRGNNYQASVNGSLSGPVSNTTNIVIAESALTLSKGASPATGDAGDTVNFTVTLTNGTGNNVTPAFESVLQDTLPAYLTLNLGSVSISSAGGVTGVVNNSAGSTVSYSIGAIPAGGSVTVTYSALINNNVTPGQTITNTADVVTTSLPGSNGTTSNATGSANVGSPGADNGERTGSLVNANDLHNTAQSTVTIQPIVPVKTIVATSEASTTGANVTIGEIVRYRLQVQVPESNTLTNFALNDALPAGLTFLNDGTAYVALIGNSGGLTSSTLSGAGLQISGNQATVNGLTPSFALPGGAITGGPFTSGTGVVFNLGTIDNADRDADQEFVVIEFNAIVDNSAAGNNQAGNTRGNTFTASLNGAQSGPASNVANVTIVEPSITNLTKGVSTTTADAGDTVTYTVTYSNTGATAFETRLTDVVPAFMTLNVASVSVTLGGGAAGITNSSAANNVDVTIASIPAGGTVSVTYTATLNANVTPAQVLTNGAQLVYTSLPGATGTTGNPTGSNTPGAAGGNTGERNGSGGLNDYTGATSANISVPNGSINKAITATSLIATSGSNVNVGETITYTLSVTLPEGSSPSTLVVDTLPAGLSYVVGSASVNTSGFGGTASLTSTTVGVAGVTFDLGTVTVNNDNNAANNTFTITFTALVQNVVGNEGVLPGQTSLPNGATLQINGGAVLPSNSVTATVVEPQLKITKTLLNPDTTVDAGTVMDYQIVVQHTAASTGPAFDIALADALASIGLNINLLSLTITPNYNGAASGYLTVTDNTSASGLNLTLDRLDVGDSVTITYSATVGNSPAAGSTVTNTASLTAYDSLPGAGGRAGTPVSSNANFTINTNSLSGFVYRDLDNDGAFNEAPVQGLANVPVRLLFAGANGLFGDGDDITFNTTTAANGGFAFTGLRPGNYRLIEVTQPAGLLDGQDQPGDAGNPFGGNAGAVGTDLISGIVIGADSNQSQPNFNFGELPPAVLGNFVWQDSNGNGRQDAGEPGVNSVTVTLTGTDDLGAITPLVTTTSGGGLYSFGNLRPGSYQVAFSNLPAGAVFTIDNSAVANTATDSDADPGTGVSGTITLVAGQTDATADAGIYVPVTIGDRVWFDINGNGVQNAGEPGIVGVTITAAWGGADGVVGNGDDADFTTTTGANGIWSLANLPPGNYRIVASNIPDGFSTATYDLDGTGTPDTVTLTLAAAANRSDVDFGYRGAGTIGDFVWVDSNGDGVQDLKEPGIPNAAVTLTWFGQDATLGGGDDVVFSTLTNAVGAYQFTGLPAGNFSVSINPASIPANLTATFDLDGSATANSTVISLADGEARDDADFGYQGNASVGDTVWYDLDANGVKDAGEPGIDAATVTLVFGGLDGNLATPGDNITFSTTTDANGKYLFEGLPVSATGVGANYRVTVSGVPVEYNSPTFDIDGTGTAGTSTFRLNATQNRTDLDFGYRGNSTLSGFVYRDTSNDGLFQAGGSVPEVGISGVTMTVAGNDFFGNAISRSTVTGPNGAYTFAGLIAGDYTVSEQLQTTTPLNVYLDGKDTAGTTGGDNSTNDVIAAITLGNNGASTGNNFGELLPSSLAGSAYVDANGDGVRGSGEVGVQNVSIHLTGTDDLGNAVDATLLTDVSGLYLFTNLRPGTYTITEAQPAAYFDGGDAVGTVGGTLADDEVSAIALAPGQNGLGYTFGERRTSLSGTVFIDRGRDGGLDPEDTGRIAGVTLTLRDSLGAVVATVQTDAAGNYVFGDLTAGDYTLDQSQPNGYGSSTANSLALTIPVEGLTDVNFGETTGSLSGVVYLDVDKSSDLSAGDAGLSGVLITLTGTDANGTAVSRTTTTAADGSYTFGDLVGGTYTLSETQPIAYRDGVETLGSLGGTLVPTDSVASIVLLAATDGVDYQFGELQKLPPGRGGITGTVFADLDKSGALDGGEHGIAGVTVRLRNSLGVVVATATTDVAGAYRFGNLLPGDYTVAETQPAAYGSSTPNVLTPVSVTAGTITADQNFGETYASLAGSVYLDANNDGSIDIGEMPLGGVTVTLTGTDVNGTAISRTTLTAGDGSYFFGTLLTGTYTLTESQPPKYADGRDTIGTSGGVLGGDTFTTIGLGGGIDATQYNFGERGATLSGKVFVDANRNAVLNASEAGLNGVTLQLRDSQGNLVATTTTSVDGSYSFINLPAGNYSVIEAQPNGYGSSTPDSVAVSLPTTGRTGINFGETTSSISGRVYLDSNTDGSFTTGESGIGGTTVTLTGTDASGAAISLTTTTGTNGLYSFTDLLSGNYTLNETQPGAYNDGAESAGTAGVLVLTDDQFAGIGLGSSFDATGYDFGETLATPAGTGTIIGTVFIDRNKDTTLDSGEAGLGGIIINLLDNTNAVIGTTTTSPDGSYAFTGIAPGSGYNVLQSAQPLAFGSSTPNIVSGINVLADGVSVVDFGETAGSLSGVVYFDRDANGVFSAGDSGLAGVIVDLNGTDVNGNALALSTTTAADGTYVFTDLPAGDYQVTETQPADYLDGADTVGSSGGSLVNPDAIGSITLPPAADGIQYNFGENGLSLSGSVFVDTDKDGTLNETGTGIGGVTLQLVDSNGHVVGSTTTAPDGTYTFRNLLAGGYTLVETQPAAYGSSTVNSVPVTLAIGNTPPSVDFGETTGSVSGVVYHDLNNDGAIDSNDLLIGGAQITLTGVDVNGGAVTLTTTTLPDGSYTFTGLLAGTYQLSETQPSGFSDGRETVGSAGGNSNVNDLMSGIGIGGGKDEIDYLFGERTPSDLVVTKTDGRSQVRPGAVLTYTITIHNPALQDADGVLVTDQFPADVLDFVSASNGGNFDPATGTIRWNVGVLAGSNAQTITLTITARVKTEIPAGSETFTNLVTAVDTSNPGTDPTPRNNTARDTDRVLAAPDLYVLKTDNLTTTTVGDTVSYTISGGNAGDQGAGGVIIRDTLPKGVKFFSGSNGGKLVNGEVVWNLGTLRPGETFRLTVKVVVEQVPSGGQILNPVTIEDQFGSTEDPTPENNRAFDLTGVKPLFVPPSDGLVFAFDSFNDFSGGRRKGFYDYASEPEIYRLPILPLAPIYSGEADPGATLFISLVNARGVTIGEQTVMVDAGGNWLATFPSSTIRDVPSSVRITEIPAPYSIADGTGNNLRTYFSPALNPGHFFTEAQMTALLGASSAPLLRGLGLENPLQLGTVKYGGELLGSQATASGY